jgi:hypothetical protein
MADDEIVAEDREPFEAVAIKFGDDLRTANVDGACQHLRSEVKQAVPRERMSVTMRRHRSMTARSPMMRTGV